MHTAKFSSAIRLAAEPPVTAAHKNKPESRFNMELKIFSAFFGVILAVLNLSGCISGQNITASETSSSFEGKTDLSDEYTSSEENEMKKMILTIGNTGFTAVLEDNEAAKAFTDMMKEAPIVIQMSDYSGFEKVGSLGKSLPADNKQTVTESGDIVLYNGDQIVIFYGSNSWSYTRLGKVNDLTGWEEALGSGDVTVTFSLE